MFFEKDDDDQDFLNPKSSKLGALFGMDKAESKGGNESLTYTAPKQPKKKESTLPAKGTGPAVSYAIAVHAYKYVDNKYASQGKLGAAILTNHATSEYSILMYVSQQQKITSAKITSSFTYTTQPNKYAQFYDDSRQSWSILFDSEQNHADFAKHVCIAKALTTGTSLTTLCSQDLSGGEGGQLQDGDSVEVKYTGWLLTNNTFGQVFDSNQTADKLFRFKLGAGKVIKGWDTGVVGMKKGGKRFLVMPPGMAYGSQGMGNRVPANSTLLFEVEVVRVKLVGRESSLSPAPTPTAAPTAQENDGDMEAEDQTVKGRTKSITEHIAHSPTQDTSKAKLISRMAKMGKPMLPLSGAVAAGPDSDEEHVPESPIPITDKAAQETPVHRPVPRAAPQTVVPPQVQQQQQPVYPAMSQAQSQPAFLQNLPGAQQMAVYQPQAQQNFLQQQQQQMMQGFQPQMYPGGVSTQQPQAVPGTSLPPYIFPGMPQGQGDMMLLSETRQQNTEMRLSLSKVSDKMDQVLQKIDHMNSQSSGTAMMPNMETSVLLHNITRVVQENERLKKDVFDKSAKIESLNDKISGLLQQNQSYVEKSQVLMEQRNEGLLSSANQVQSKVLSLEQDKVALTKNLSEATSQISSLQMELTSLKKKEFELSQQLDIGSKDTRKQGEEVERLRTQHADDESQISELQRQLRDEKQGRKAAESQISQLQEEMTDLRDNKQLIEKSLSERKKKAAEERRQLEEDMEDMKNNLEGEIQTLKNKLRKQKTSASAASQEQISQLEEEINNDWQIKCDKLLAAANDKHNRALQALKEEKTEMQDTLQELEKKLATVKSSYSGSDQRISELEAEVEELEVWKDKYNSLRANAATMKERYEEKLSNLEEEKEEAEQLVEKLRSEVSVGGATSAGGGATEATSSQALLDQVKKIMNNVYKELREVFEADESYTGTEILTVILNAIKSTTMALMKQQNKVQDEESEEEDDDDEDEEEDDEEDEDEDDDESEEEKVDEETDKVETDKKTEVVEEVQEKEIPTQKDENKTEPEPSVTQVVTPPELNTAADPDQSKSESSGASEPSSTPNTEETVQDTQVEQTQETAEEATSDTNTVQPEQDQIPKTADTGDDKPVTETPAETVIDAAAGAPPVRKAGSLEDLLDSALETKATPLVSTEPPPLMDGSSEEEEEEEEPEKSRTKSIFNDEGDDDDDHVADTLGFTEKPVANGDTKKQPVLDEDLKPKPPPPLFGDDDDDDDLDWLS